MTIEVMSDGVILGDPYSYQGGGTATQLRSGTDGPYSKLADELCEIRR